jgi:hypothetical protein
MAMPAIFGVKVVSIAAWGMPQSLPVSMIEILAIQYNLIQESFLFLFADEIRYIVSR